MIEVKLLVGRYLQFTPTPPRPYQGTPAAFVPVNCPGLTIQESHRRNPGAWYNPFRNVGGDRESAVIQGTHATKDRRNFKWLPWYEGDISCTNLDRDVLTGPMSGCVLVSYQQGPHAMAGHIGTVTVTEVMPATINTDVKTLWNHFAVAHPGDVIGGFNPVAATVPMHPPAQHGDVAGQTWGLFTTTGNYYAVQVYAQANNANNFRIAAVHQVPSMTLHQLQNL